MLSEDHDITCKLQPCHVCHTQTFAVLFLLPSCCVNSLLSKRDAVNWVVFIPRSFRNDWEETVLSFFFFFEQTIFFNIIVYFLESRFYASGLKRLDNFNVPSVKTANDMRYQFNCERKGGAKQRFLSKGIYSMFMQW